MKRSRIALMGTAIVVLPVAVGGFMMQRREATDAARLFAQVFEYFCRERRMECQIALLRARLG